MLGLVLGLVLVLVLVLGAGAGIALLHDAGETAAEFRGVGATYPPPGVMSEYEAMVAAISIIFGTSTAVAVTWIIARAVLKARSMSAGTALDDGSVSRLEARLDRIEHALDSVAVEVERVSEGQRFTTRLLSERVEGQR